MIRTTPRLFLCTFVLSAALYADAATTFYGTTSGHPVFNRPDSLTTLSGVLTRYSVQPFFPNDDSSCTIESIQESDFDGMIFLYERNFDPASPLDNLMDLSDDSIYGVGSSRIDPVDLLFSDNYFLVTAGFDGLDVGTFSSQIFCDAPTTRVLAGDDVFGDDTVADYDGRIAELLGGRFQVSVTGFDFAFTPFIGRTVPLASTDSAIFWFFQPANFELLVKMVDGCSFNNRYWVYYAATTNVDFTLTVDDTFDFDPPIHYHNPLGTTLFTAVTDSSAFATCF